MEPLTFDEWCAKLRDECKSIEGDAREVLNNTELFGEQAFHGQHNEIRAHLTLAVRHLEDARMRFGKALQYFGDGVSIYDKM